jgi:hypothetical protein
MGAGDRTGLVDALPVHLLRLAGGTPYTSINNTIAANRKKIIALHPVITPIVRTPGRYRTLIPRLQVGGKVHAVAPVTVDVVAHAANQAALATTGDYVLLLQAVDQVAQASVPDFPPAFLQWLNTIHANPQISAAVRQLTAYVLAHFEFDARDYQNCITLANDAEAYAGNHISTGGLHGAALVYRVYALKHLATTKVQYDAAETIWQQFLQSHTNTEACITRRTYFNLRVSLP